MAAQGRIKKTFIQDLLNRADIVQVVEDRLPLKKQGANYVSCCPFHQENTPSFSVSPNKQFYYCFGCGAHGNAVGFLMEYDRLSFVEAVEELASFLQVPVEYEEAGFTVKSAAKTLPSLYDVMLRAQRYFQTQLRPGLYPQAVDYLKNRGLTGETAQQFGLGYAPDAWDGLLKQIPHEVQPLLLQAGLVVEKGPRKYYDRFRHRIMFPIRDRRGRIIGFGGRVLSKEQEPKYLNSPETPIFHKGKELYGLYELLQSHAANKVPSILIVEGYMDVIALAQQGIRQVVATLGTATTQDHCRQLFRYTKTLIFCFDGDKAGRTAATRALNIVLPFMFEEHAVKFLFLPEGEDPDSLVRKEGAQAFQARLQEAMPLTTFLLQSAEAQLNLTNLEDRAKYLHRMRTWLVLIPQGPYTTLLIQAMAKKTHLSPDQVQANLAAKKTSVNEKSLAVKPVSLVERALTLLVHFPALAKETSMDLMDADPQLTLLRQVIQTIQAQGIAHTGELLAHVDSQKIAPYLQEKRFLNILPHEDILPSEYSAIMARLREQVQDQMIKALLAKARQTKLTLQEQQNLQQLFSKMKK